MRRHFSVLMLLVAVSMLLWAALPATETFTYTHGTDLATASANWTYNTGSFQAHTTDDGQILLSSYAGETLARWNADTFGANQYSQAVSLYAGWDNYSGIAVRISTDGAVTAYVARFGGWGCEVAKFVAGTKTSLGTTDTTPGFGGVMRLEVSGTSITLKKNGTTLLGPYTDSAISAGAAGLAGYGNAVATHEGELDDWEGGNLASAAVAKRRMIQ